MGPSGENAALWSRIGALPAAPGVRFVLWSPAARHVELLVEGGGSVEPGTRALEPAGDGLFATIVPGIGAGARYRYRIDGRGPYPDPASRFQPDGVHGASEVIDPAAFSWTDARWPGRPLERIVLYELHVGAFTPQGTFRAAIGRLADLAALGITALELMPVHAFPGDRNWGYDPAALFAPARSYGRPNDLRALVDAAHALGLAVHLDVVYNHLGPDGAYVAALLPMLHPGRRTEWGAAMNVDGPDGAGVRELLIQNAIHWIREYHLDGLRLDATPAIVDQSPRHFVGELAARARTAAPERPIVVIAEDVRNEGLVVKPEGEGGWECDGVWSFDFHHQAHRLLTGETHGYYVDSTDSVTDLERIVTHGWRWTGEWSRYWERSHGTDPEGIPPWRLVFYLQNHDEVGNRSGGERLHHLAELAAVRAATTLLLLAPQTPLLFMGQEWAATTPFLFFTDHPERLGERVAASRRRELGDFEGASPTEVVHPQDEATFRASRLDWEECLREPHASMLRFHRRLLELRRSEPALCPGSSTRVSSFETGGAKGIVLTRGEGSNALTAIVCLLGAGVVPAALDAEARPLLTSEDPVFAVDPQLPQFDGVAGRVTFARPGAVVVRGAPRMAGAEPPARVSE